MKNIIAIILPVMLIAAILAAGAAFAADKERVMDTDVSQALTGQDTDLGRGPEGVRLPRFLDYVGMVTEEQAEEITKKLDGISERYSFDTVIVVVPALDEREARLYGVDFFEQNGFGYGEERDGIILLQATEERDFGFATLGYGLTVFTDSVQDRLEDMFLPYLRNDDFYGAYIAFADGVEDFLAAAETGEPYDGGNLPTDTGSETWTETGPSPLSGLSGEAVALSLIVAFFVALIVTLVWKRQLKSVRRQKQAALYIRRGSMVLTDSRDIFLYKHTTSVRRARDSDSGSSSGSSSGSFSSSSGSSSSGHSGKY